MKIMCTCGELIDGNPCINSIEVSDVDNAVWITHAKLRGSDALMYFNKESAQQLIHALQAHIK